MESFVKSAAALAVAATMTAGCAVGPDFRAPAPPSATTYTATALPAETAATPGVAGAPQRFIAGNDVPAQWWALFHSEALDRTIRQALADSPTLAAAQARLREARENRRATYGTLFPSVDGNVSASRQKISGASFGQPGSDVTPFTLINASVSVSYALDLFGGTRRELEALQAQIDYQSFQLEGAYLTLTSNIVTAAVQEASLRAQLRATREIIAAEEEQLKLVERQVKIGGASLPDQLAQEAQLAQTRTTLPPLEKGLAQTRHQLAALAGRLPGDAGELPEFVLTELTLPPELPVSLPSALVRQRPDIRASEELLHAASAQIGVATANLYPQVTLSGSYGSQATRLENLFSTGTSVWSLGAGVLQPIFRGGELTAKRRAAIAAFDAAEAQYRATVVQAFQGVADVLRALEQDALTLKAQAAAETAAHDSLDLSRKQFEIGAASYLTLLTAERQHKQAQLALVQAQAVRLADTAALFQALGGGWWNRDATPSP
ncbi:MAG TPA: efflux transporter outer membrane subunit [Geobacteraceae bacterium]|nr:efflux transporter outer membrane subunit [Geobacteraceae bacterium]